MILGSSDTPTPESPLTPREIDALRLVAKGFTNKQVATQLNVALDTVGYYLRQIFAKLGVQNRAQAVSVGIALGILPNDDKPTVPAYQVFNPYKGLSPFQSRDADIFFGREQLVQELVQRIIDPETPQRFFAIVGPSGIGKSSLVNAGLIPALRTDNRTQTKDWMIFQTPPDAQAFSRITAAISDAEPPQNTLIILDQFESVFTLIDTEAQQHLIQTLLDLLNQTTPLVRIMVVLRADMLTLPLQDTRLGPLFQNHSWLVSPLGATELERVIAEPAKHAGLIFEPGLIGTIIGDVMRQSGSLPLLQFALAQLVEKSSNKLITIKAYEELGGVTGALTSQIEAAYNGLSEECQAFVPPLFLGLVTISENRELIRKRSRLSDFESYLASPETIEKVISTFVDLRVLMLDWDIKYATPIIDLAHESLVESWPRFKKWVEDNREALLLQRQLSMAVGEWLNSGKNSDFLLSGVRLDQAKMSLSTAENSFTIRDKNYQEFINASLVEQERASQAEFLRRERELQMARELAKAQTAKAMRFQQAAFRAGGVAIIAIAGVLAAIMAAIYADNQTLIANQKLATAAMAQEEALAQQATLQFEATVSAFDQNRLATLVPIIAQFPPTNPVPLTYLQKLSTATAIAASYKWTPVVMRDNKNIEMVKVPPGCFMMGVAGTSDTQPVSEVCINDAYWIDRNEIANFQFDAFVKAEDGYQNDKNWTSNGLEWRIQQKRSDRSRSDACMGEFSADEKPVVCVTWYEAYAYCHWRGGRLPNEAEWEYAARSPANFIYPWGNTFNLDNATYSDNAEGHTASVGSKPAGASWVGANDLAGNVWEWVLTADAKYDTNYASLLKGFRYPYNATDGRNSLDGHYTRIVRGGSWGTNAFSLRGAVRGWNPDDYQVNYIGFRCARFP